MKAKLRLGLLIGILAYTLSGLLVQIILLEADDDSALLLLALAGLPLVGLIVLLRRPGNRIGLLLMATVAFVATSGLLLAIARAQSVPLRIRIWAELLSDPFWFLFFASMGSLVILFPTGSISNRLDRLAFVILCALVTIVIASSLVQPRILETTLQPNPLGIELMGPISAWFLGEDSFLLFLGTLALGLAGMLKRWKAAEGVGRLQLRLFGAGAVVFFTGLVVSMAISETHPASEIGFGLAILAIPAAIGAAILRYRLYDIDRIISRTVAYAMVVMILATIFVIGVALTQRVLPIESQLGVVVSTLVVAALFNPLRRRVQTEVDRRFNRSKYDSHRVLDEFTARLRGDLDFELIVTALLSTAQETVQPSYLSVWVPEPAARVWTGRSVDEQI